MSLTRLDQEFIKLLGTGLDRHMSCKYYVDISNSNNANKTYITLLHPNLTEDVRLTSDDARNVAKQLLAAADAADALSKIREEEQGKQPIQSVTWRGVDT